MASLYNQVKQPGEYIGSISVSYDYDSNFVGIALHTQDNRQDLSGINFNIVLKLLSGGSEQKNLTTNDKGQLGFYYNLANVLSILPRTELALPSGESIPVFHEVIIDHSAQADELLTLSHNLDGYYLNIFGRLSTEAVQNVSGVAVDVTATNYDTDNVIKLKCTTSKTGEYSTKFLAGDGDWEIQAVAVVKNETIATSPLLNLILRRDEQTFTVRVTTAELSSRYTGYASYPSSTPPPGGGIEVISKNVWEDDKHYIGRVVRDSSAFYFAFYKVGATSNGHFGFPELFQLDYSNRGFITGSSLIVNDTEKYDMGKPFSYSNTHIYFDITQGAGKDFFDKYFLRGTAPQTVKMEWIFRI